MLDDELCHKCKELGSVHFPLGYFRQNKDSVSSPDWVNDLITVEPQTRTREWETKYSFKRRRAGMKKNRQPLRIICHNRDKKKSISGGSDPEEKKRERHCGKAGSVDCMKVPVWGLWPGWAFLPLWRRIFFFFFNGKNSSDLSSNELRANKRTIMAPSVPVNKDTGGAKMFYFVKDFYKERLFKDKACLFVAQ